MCHRIVADHLQDGSSRRRICDQHGLPQGVDDAVGRDLLSAIDGEFAAESTRESHRDRERAVVAGIRRGQGHSDSHCAGEALGRRAAVWISRATISMTSIENSQRWNDAGTVPSRSPQCWVRCVVHSAAPSSWPRRRPTSLLVAERLDRVKVRGLARRVVSEEDPNGGGKYEPARNGCGGQQRRPVRHG
jgi:hypothetical protein